MNRRFRVRARLALALIAIAGLATISAAADPDFSTHWHDGKAELDGYRLSVQRYGEPRVGQAVLIYVTEPLRLSTRVKADDTSRNPVDVVDVLKLNLVRDFQTGIYDYNTMSSLFVRSDTFAPLKLSFSSAEWCGHVYEELLVDAKIIRHDLKSYFEGESATGTLPRPANGLLEDELFIRLRGLRGDFLKPGEKRSVRFLGSPFFRRLAHRPATWIMATIQRRSAAERVVVPAGTFATTTYVVTTADGREGRFHVEQAYPHRIVKWSWAPKPATAAGSTLASGESAELTGTSRTPYWQMNKEGGEGALRELGLKPTVPRPR